MKKSLNFVHHFVQPLLNSELLTPNIEPRLVNNTHQKLSELQKGRKIQRLLDL